MDAFTPQQTVELIARIGTRKSGQRLDKLFVNALLVGPLLGFGCAIVLSTEAAPWFQANAPGLIRTIGAFFFPVGLVMILLTGADLLTGNMMFTIVAFLERRITMLQLLKVWSVSFVGNLAGMLFFMALITGYSGTYDNPVWRETLFNFATSKVVTPQWHQIFLRGIGANWLVCLAIYFHIGGRDIGSKIIATWFPTMTFVALGFDHLIANMYFIPSAIFYGHPNIDTSLYIWKSLIPTFIGNILGGSLFVGTSYWYLYLTGNNGVEVDFNNGAIKTAVKEASGPTESASEDLSHAQRIDGQPPTMEKDISLPHAGSDMHSGFGKDLNGERYGRSMRASADEERGN